MGRLGAIPQRPPTLVAAKVAFAKRSRKGKDGRHPRTRSSGGGITAQKIPSATADMPSKLPPPAGAEWDRRGFLRRSSRARSMFPRGGGRGSRIQDALPRRVEDRIIDEGEGCMAVPRPACEALGHAGPGDVRRIEAGNGVAARHREAGFRDDLPPDPPPPATLCPRLPFGNLSPAMPSSGVVPGGSPWRPAHHLHEKVSRPALWRGGARSLKHVPRAGHGSRAASSRVVPRAGCVEIRRRRAGRGA